MKIGELVERYLDYRHSLGAKFTCGAQQLRHIARLFGVSMDVGSLTKEDFWRAVLTDGHVTLTSINRKSSLAVFFRWCVARGFLRDMPQLPDLPQNLHPRRPHIYSNDEIRRLLSANHKCLHPKSTVQVECIHMIVLLTYTLGLRISETLSLTMGDIDTSSNVAKIRETKFYKTRVVPYNSYVANKLDGYMRWRAKNGMPVSPESHLFMNRADAPLGYDVVKETFYRLCDAAGIEKLDGGKRYPRIHDLRHTFAVQRLLAWYRKGRDVQALLPKLSVYMGHSSIVGTTVYLSMTPDLLRESCRRFELYAEGGSSHE